MPAERGLRRVQRVVSSMRTLEGGGFAVRRPFPTHTIDQLDPFLLLDEMGPTEYAPDQALGAPDHPHRGFETVTYVLAGAMEHRDSAGHLGRLGSGDVQWMTAGSGVVHSELPASDFRKSGGKMHGFQLWVNLPRKDKMIEPRYQDIPAARIPVVRSPDGKVEIKIIAGEALGQKAVIDTRIPIFYLHFTIEPGGSIAQGAPPEYNVFAYVVDGEGRFGEERQVAKSGEMVTFGHDGDSVLLAAPEEARRPVSVLLIGGVPIGEPVARYGPFVMNTPEEIYKAFDDYRSGRMGHIRS
jgi:redox-sensitive bicupin YhaK (pirin superfamily)